MDEYTRACLVIDAAKRLTGGDAQERLIDLFVPRGVPEDIRSDRVACSLQSAFANGWDGVA